MLGIPQHVLRARRPTENASWWQTSTPAYLAGYIAYEVLHIPVMSYLQLPKAERIFAQAYFTARSLKQQRGDQGRRLEAQHQQWANSWRQQYGHHSSR